MDPDTRQVENWLSRILNRDAMTFEDAYWGPRPDASLVVPRLLELLSSTDDAYSRGKILELLGESGDPSVAGALLAYATHPDPQVRQWAKLALSALKQGTPWQQRE